jgi:hypothetical protein
MDKAIWRLLGARKVNALENFMTCEKKNVFFLALCKKYLHFF